jgi:hypothetical protein
LKFQLASDQVHFVDLRFVQIGRISPVTARIVHVLVQKVTEQFEAEIVVTSDVLTSVLLRLIVEQCQRQQMRQHRQVLRVVAEVATLKDLEGELAHIGHVPITAHVPLSERTTIHADAAHDQTTRESRTQHSNVGVSFAVDPDVAILEFRVAELTHPSMHQRQFSIVRLFELFAGRRSFELTVRFAHRWFLW